MIIYFHVNATENKDKEFNISVKSELTKEE